MTDPGFGTFLSGIGFTLGAIALGLWAMLAVYWYRQRTGASRIALVWLAALIMLSTGFRVWLQLQAYGEDIVTWQEVLRSAINVGYVALGYYMFKNKVGNGHE